jgi:fluoride exporter
MMYVLLAIGGVLGALCRYHVARYVQTRVKYNFPLGTLLINVSGSFGLGLLIGLITLHPNWPVDPLRFGFSIGFFAAYTTFSSFAFETVELWRQSRQRMAVYNLTLQPVLGVLAAWAGLLAGTNL